MRKGAVKKMEEKFKEIIARYCTIDAANITNDMTFRDDLNLSSFDLMTFLGDLEDEFDVEFDLGADEHRLGSIRTIGDALEFLREYTD